MPIESSAEQQQLLELRKLQVEMADRVSQRRQQSNSFYLSINTAIIGAGVFASSQQVPATISPMLSIVGIAIAALWARGILTYRDINRAKFQVIHEIEDRIEFNPFQREWQHLGAGSDASKYRPFFEIEVLVPWLFGLLHLTYLALALGFHSP